MQQRRAASVVWSPEEPKLGALLSPAAVGEGYTVRGSRRVMQIARPALIAIFIFTIPQDWARAPFKVGSAQRAFIPSEPYCWRGAKTHALLTTVWYPADSRAV